MEKLDRLRSTMAVNVLTDIKYLKYIKSLCWLNKVKVIVVLQFHPGPARKLSTNLYDLYHC